MQSFKFEGTRIKMLGRQLLSQFRRAWSFTSAHPLHGYDESTQPGSGSYKFGFIWHIKSCMWNWLLFSCIYFVDFARLLPLRYADKHIFTSDDRRYNIKIKSYCFHKMFYAHETVLTTDYIHQKLYSHFSCFVKLLFFCWMHFMIPLAILYIQSLRGKQFVCS